MYDTGHCEEGLRKAEESIAIHRSFEAFFLKAYALADSGPDPPSSAAVVSLLEEALKCPSDRLRKGQVCGLFVYLFTYFAVKKENNEVLLRSDKGALELSDKLEPLSLFSTFRCVQTCLSLKLLFMPEINRF